MTGKIYNRIGAKNWENFFFGTVAVRIDSISKLMSFISRLHAANGEIAGECIQK